MTTKFKDELFLEAEKKLRNYNIAKIRIDNINLELEILEQEILGYKGVNYENIKTSKTNKVIGLDNLLIQKEKRINNLEKEKRIKEIEIKKIELALGLLNETELKIIQLRYLKLNPLTWEQISMKVGYSVSSCQKQKIKAINKIKKLLVTF